MQAAVIDCKKLSKRYGLAPEYALKDLDLQVAAGEVYGFLGPNGAGKSTTIRTLMNFIQPSGGSANIMGLDIVEDSVAIKRQVGYMSGEVALYRRLTGRQFLDYMAELQPVKSPDYRRRTMERFKVELDKPIESLSKGNRQKLGLVQALQHDPDVLILDEPTSGLDPLMQAVFYEVVEEVKARGVAVFLSSHDLAEVRKMCDRIGFIRDGQLVSEQTIADLQVSAAHNFEIAFKDAPPLAELKKLPGAEARPLGKHAVSLQLKGDLKPLFVLLAKHQVTALDKPELNLEDEFLQFYKNKKGES